jgi:(p)ppGpp synthase/HD superfamily hydrolase
MLNLTPLDIATHAHRGTADSLGRPYIEHPIAVADAVRAAGGSQYAIDAAHLHDVLEDTVIRAEDLLRMGIGPRVVNIVTRLTRTPDVPPSTYYARIRRDPDALLVKVCDVHHNLTPSRLLYLPTHRRERLARKYADALVALLGVP